MLRIGAVAPIDHSVTTVQLAADDPSGATVPDLAVVLLSIRGAAGANAALEGLAAHTPLRPGADVTVIMSGAVVDDPDEVDLMDPASAAAVVALDELGPMADTVLANSTTDWVLVLSDDVVLTDGWLDPLLEASATDPSGMIAAPILEGLATDPSSPMAAGRGVCLLVPGFVVRGGVVPPLQRVPDVRLQTLPALGRSAVNRPRVRSFDVFDTLIARRCIEPLRVFELVEERAGVPGFARARREAELSVLRLGPFDLDTIYAALPGFLAVPETELARLRDLEVRVELEQTIPVAEHLAEVSAGDVLVSDMYLGPRIIRELLAKAGLERELALVVTNGGKHTGEIWPELAAAVEVVEHLGDNQRSDVETPTEHGIAARRTTRHQPTEIERWLIGSGLPQVGQLCRELRLGTWSPDPDVRAAQLVQSQANFPLMLVASAMLARLAERLDRRSVLMSSRDCHLWDPLFQQVADRLGIACRSRYFYTGRLPRTQPSSHYLRYARELFTDDALVVDICGTGWSLSRLAGDLGVTGLPVFLLHHMPKVAAQEDAAPSLETCDFYSAVPATARGVRSIHLEMANTAAHGTVHDVRYVAGSVVPVFAEDRRPQPIRELVLAQERTFRTGIAMLSSYSLDDVRQLGDDALEQVLLRLYQELSASTDLARLYGADFAAEHDEAADLLGL